jgi:hypothetical protein
VAREFNVSRQILVDGLRDGIDFWIECKDITGIAHAKSKHESVSKLTEKFELAHTFLKAQVAKLNCKELDEKLVDELNY